MMSTSFWLDLSIEYFLLSTSTSESGLKCKDLQEMKNPGIQISIKYKL